MLKHPEFANSTVTVRYEGVVPDTFKDDAEVIVTGTLGSDGVFQASDLLAKCPSKYEAEMKSKGTY
jgi:cytochrome c-type biogenesis protein CcmE